MAVVTTNLGTITAYGDAVAAGYTGTKAQWQALMANYATVGQQAARDAQTASQAAQTATTKAGEASQSATAAAASAASITTPDATLTQAGVAADAKATGDEISDLKEELNAEIDALAPNNSYDIIPGVFIGTNGTDKGVTYTFTDANTCVISGTSTTVSSKNIINHTGSMPYGMKLGKTYVVYVDGANNAVFLRIFLMNGSSIVSNNKITGTTTLTVPASGVDGIIARLEVARNNTVSATLQYRILTVDTLKNLWDETNSIKDILANRNSVDYTPSIFNGTSATVNGVTFTFDGSNACAVSGTATNAYAARNVVSYLSGFPDGLSAGSTFFITAENLDTDVYIQAFMMNGTTEVSGQSYTIYDFAKITIPTSGVDGMVIRIKVRNDATVNRTVSYSIYSAPSNIKLYEMISEADSFYGDYYAFGDSLTMGSINVAHTAPSVVYPTLVGKVCKLTVHNMGIGGQGLVLNQGAPTEDHAYDTVSSTDISSAKLITLAWGTNDTPSSAFGSPSDASGAATVCGQMKAILDYIIANNHTCQVVIVGMPRSSLRFDEDGAGGWSRDDFETAMKIIGDAYCVPFVSYKQCTLCNETNWMAVTSSGDRVHPSDDGYRITSAYLAGEISKYFHA